MEHAQREAALRARHLVVIQLHRVDGAAAELIVLRVGTEDRTQQNAGLSSLRMCCRKIALRYDAAGIDVQFLSSSVSPHMPLTYPSRRPACNHLHRKKTQKDYKGWDRIDRDAEFRIASLNRTCHLA